MLSVLYMDCFLLNMFASVVSLPHDQWWPIRRESRNDQVYHIQMMRVRLGCCVGKALWLTILALLQSDTALAGS